MRIHIIRVWATYTELFGEATADGRIVLRNRQGNVMFDGTGQLFHACVERGFFHITYED